MLAEDREKTEMRPLEDESTPSEAQNSDVEVERSETEKIEDSEFEALEKGSLSSKGFKSSNFGESLTVLQMSPTEVQVLRSSFDSLLMSMGNDRAALGDAIYGLKVSALSSMKDRFTTPRAVVSLRFFNCFRLLLDKADNENELKLYVETLAFKHLGNDVTEYRVDSVIDAFQELMEQNVAVLPPGTAAAWRELLSYLGSCYRFVGETYGERLSVIKEDWEAVQASGREDREDRDQEDEDEHEKHEKHEKQEEEDAEGRGAETFSFGRMCAFSTEVMGQKMEGWMEELLKVFHVLVEMIASPVHLQEECDLLAINLITRSQSIHFERFKPVMLAALRSLLPKQWSTQHESAWEWFWSTVARNLRESTMKVRAFKPFNVKLFQKLTDEHLDRFRKDIFSNFFQKAPASQDLFKQSRTRLNYIADRVLQSSCDLFQKNKDETLDELSALGLRHVGYGIPIELFGPFADSCGEVMLPLIQSFCQNEGFEGSNGSKMVWCPKDRAHQLPENEIPEHLMIEGFRWSISLTARVLVRTIMDGSTAVMQAIHFDDAKRLRRALMDAPRAERNVWQLAVMVGSQSISPLFWALRSGAHAAAKTMIQDVLTIRADRANYYYGADELFRFQPNIADNILREAPFLAETLLDGLIWRSHKSKNNLRPVIYYVKHLLQDMDDQKMLSRALISYIHFKHPKTIMHPILAFSLDLLWQRLALRFFIMDRLLTAFNFVIFILAQCYLSDPASLDATRTQLLIGTRAAIYILGLLRLIYWHVVQSCKAYRSQAVVKYSGMSFPQYLTRGSDMLSMMLTLCLLAMLTVEPLLHCGGSLGCEAWTDSMSLAYEICVILGVFLYALLLVELGSISIKFSEYRVLCFRCVEQVLLCFFAVMLTIVTFALAVAGMTRQVENLSSEDWEDMATSMSTLTRLSFGVMDLHSLHNLAQDSPLLLVVLVSFMMLVYSFFFNLLVSQFCGVYSSLAADMRGHARLARGELIIETSKAVKLARWKHFMDSLGLDQRVDFEQGDIGLAGGIKTYELALAHPVVKDQIVRFGGNTDPSNPWPEKMEEDADSIEKTVRRTIQKSLHKILGKKGGLSMSSETESSHQYSSSHSD